MALDLKTPVIPGQKTEQTNAGEPAEFGKNRTLRFSGHP